MREAFLWQQVTAMAPAPIDIPPLFGTPVDGYRMLRNFRNEVIVTNGLPVDVVFTGDSITHLCELQGYYRQLGYVVNSGISGDTSFQLCQRLQADVVQLKPRVCVVLIGVNDTFYMDEEFGSQSAEEVFSRFLDSYRSILDQLEAAHIRPVVCSITPVGEAFAGKERNALICRMNQALADLCTQRQVPLVDYHTALVGTDGKLEDGLSHDGLHPHVIGYNRMAKVLLPVLQQQLKEE